MRYTSGSRQKFLFFVASPNYSARALRTRRSYTAAMLLPDLGYGLARVSRPEPKIF